MTPREQGGIGIALVSALVLAACARGDTPSPEIARAQGQCAHSATPARPTGQQTMDFFPLIERRRSVRAFEARPVSDADVSRIVAAANRAPSAGDRQAYEVVVVSSEAQRKRLAHAAHDQSFVAEAPLVLVFVTNPARNRDRYGERGERLFCLQDATIAAAYAQLAAEALGLGSVWVGSFDETLLLQTVGAPGGMGVSSLLVVGHPAEAPAATPRRSLDDLMHRETLGAPPSRR